MNKLKIKFGFYFLAKIIFLYKSKKLGAFLQKMNENYQSLIEAELKDEPKRSPNEPKKQDLNEFLDNSSTFVHNLFDFCKKPILNPKLMNDFREQEQLKKSLLVDGMCKKLKLIDENINFNLSKSSSSSSLKNNFSNELNQNKENQVSPIAKSHNNSNEFDLSNNQQSEPSGYYFFKFFLLRLRIDLCLLVVILRLDS